MQETQDLMQRALAHELRGDDAGALELYTTIPRDEMAAGVRGRLGNLQARLGDSKAAAESYREAAEQLLADGFQNAAIAVYQRLLRVHPDDGDALLDLARVAADRGYRRDAADTLTTYANNVDQADETALAPLLAMLDAITRSPSAPIVSALLPDLRERFPDASDDLDRIAAETPDAGRSADEIDVIPGFGDAAPSSSGVVPTALDGAATAEPDVAPLEGLQTHAQDEPTLASGDDLPLMSSELEDPGASRLRPGRDHPLEPLDLLPGSMDAAALERPDQDEEAEELPLLGFGTDREPAPDPAGVSISDADVADIHDWVDLGAMVMSDDEFPAPIAQARSHDLPGRKPGEEKEDFAELLSALGVDPSRLRSEAEAGDGSYYDLGLAFKEMGLLDKAIEQLQLALVSDANSLAALEVLGECYLESGDPQRACTTLARATELSSAEDLELVGVRYWLGRCHEALGDSSAARSEYELVIGIEPGFRDAAGRLENL